MNRVFVYHTMLFAEIRKKCFGHDVPPGKIDFLSGYSIESFVTPEGHDFHTVEPNKDGKVIGRRLLLSLEEFKKLTNWEDEYRPVEVQLDSGLDATVFVLKDQYKKARE